MIGACLFSFLFFVRIRQGGFGWPLAVQAGLAAVLLVFARDASRRVPLLLRVLAWLSAFLPMLMDVEQGNAWAGLPGLIWSLWAMVSLGRSFAVEPSDRGLVTGGPYSLTRHPMYFGEFLSCLGVCIFEPSARNLLVGLLFLATLVYRIHIEERILDGYTEYAKKVHWRFLPGLW